MSTSNIEGHPVEGRKSMARRSTVNKDQARLTQCETKRPEFFDEEYEPLDRCARAIQKKIKHRELASSKGFTILICTIVQIIDVIICMSSKSGRIKSC